MTISTNSGYSIDFRLYQWWRISVPPGTGITMAEMMDAVGAYDPQQIRTTLTRLRKGRSPDPGERGARLRPLPISYNRDDGRYYDMSRITSETIRNEIPGQILTNNFDELLTRVRTIESALGRDGVVQAAARDLIQNPDIRALIAQIPKDEIYMVKDTLELISRAHELMEAEAMTRPALTPSPPTADPDEEEQE